MGGRKNEKVIRRGEEEVSVIFFSKRWFCERVRCVDASHDVLLGEVIGQQSVSTLGSA